MNDAGTPSADGETWRWHLPFDLPSVREGRLLVTEALRAHDVQPDVIDDSISVLSELLGNALRHARPLAGNQLELSVTLDERSVRLAVADGGAITVPNVVSPTPLARSGRGLGIVHTLTVDWGVKETGDGNTVFGILGRA